MITAGRNMKPARLTSWVLWPVLAAAVFVWAGSAMACNCPKEQMVKKYGTVSLLHHGPPLPPLPPPAKASAPAVTG